MRRLRASLLELELGAGAAGIGLFGVLTFSLFILVTGITMAMGKATPAAA